MRTALQPALKKLDRLDTHRGGFAMTNVPANHLPRVRRPRRGVGGFQVGINAVQAFGRREGVEISFEGQVGARGDQRVDLRTGEVFEQGRDEIEDAVFVDIVRFDQALKIGQATNVDATLDAGIEGGDPPGHRAAHRQADRAKTIGVDIVAAAQIIDGPERIVNHHAPHDLAIPQKLLENGRFRAAPAFAEGPGVDAKDVVSEAGEFDAVGWLLQERLIFDEFEFAGLVLAAVVVVIEDSWAFAFGAGRADEEAGDVLESVEIEEPFFDDHGVALFLANFPGVGGPIARREIAKKLIKLLSSRVGVGHGGFSIEREAKRNSSRPCGGKCYPRRMRTPNEREKAGVWNIFRRRLIFRARLI